MVDCSSALCYCCLNHTYLHVLGSSKSLVQFQGQMSQGSLSTVQQGASLRSEDKSPVLHLTAEKKTSCVQGSWKVSGLKGCFNCAGWSAPWLCIHGRSWSVFAALQKGTWTEHQWHHISAEPVPSAGEQSNLWQLHTIRPGRLHHRSGRRVGNAN